MKYKSRKLVPGLIILFTGFIAHFYGGAAGAVLVPVCFLAAAGWAVMLLTKFKPRKPDNDAATGMTASTISKTVACEVSDTTSGITLTALGSHYRREQWLAAEKAVDDELDIFLQIIQKRLDGHTVAILFPTADKGYKIRRFLSKSEYVNDGAIIYPGVGVIGSFLKDGLKQLNLHEIVTDSMTLYYYKRDAGIRSLMASPITGGNVERGAVIVDSTEVRRFSDDDHAYLSAIASLVGQTVYYTYLATEYRLEHNRIVSMSSIEKEFFRNLSIDAILDKIVEIIPFAIACDRLTISLRGDADSAVIRRAWGLNSEKFVGITFSTDEKSLAGLVYARNLCLFRNFTGNRYETRYVEGEPQSEELSSFIAFPIGVDKCKGAFFLESLRKDAFSEFNRDLLSRLAMSAGLAIEKLQIIEKANTLATHDGLTGLINHREFQSLLKDEITRSIRYNDPLTLVICDIDFFKKVNDTYGHQFGDAVLREVSACLSENIRDGVDMVARYGGEEFALVLVKTDAFKAMETVERIRQHIEKQLLKSPRGEEIGVTMSFGIAVYPQHAKQIDMLIQKADKALYRAKENGRNRVELF
jgi:two-component system, cell cycle response regulator